MSQQTAKELPLAVATGAGAFLAGAKIATTPAGCISTCLTAGASLLVFAASNAVLSSSYTPAYGNASARYFLQTAEIGSSEAMVEVLIALIGDEMNVDMGCKEYLA